MSYLDVPRIHLAGKFFTDPSTVNNDPKHYDPACDRPSPWQEPNGQHRFQLRDCNVRSVIMADGPSSDDPLIGATVATTDTPSTAKIVDIDVYQQGVPTIYGLQLQITLANGISVTGNMDPAVLNGLWINAVLPTRSWEDGDYLQDSFGGDMNACGFFQTVVRFPLSTNDFRSSPALQLLQSQSITEDGCLLLSFKFVTDGYQNVPQDTEYRLGRVVGTLGPQAANEPRYNSGQRTLMPRPFAKTDPWYSPSFNKGYFKVDQQRKKLVFDLSNSICRQMAGGEPVDLGKLTVKVNALDPPAIPLGELECSAFTYENNAQIVELDLTDQQLAMVEKFTLQIEMSRTDLGDPVVLRELPNSLDIVVETRPIRVQGALNTAATTTVYVSQQGQPLAGKQLAVYVESVTGKTPGITVPPGNRGNSPDAEGAITASITPTDTNGFATVTLTVAKTVGPRTPELDGQLFFAIVYDPEETQPDWTSVVPPQEQLISCLLFSDYPVNTNPEWPEVQAIFAPYMKMFPYMKEQVDTNDPHTFTIFSVNPPWTKVYGPDVKPGPLGIQAGAIPFYLTRDFNDPRYMPLTRDLSDAKLMTALYFIKTLQGNYSGQPPASAGQPTVSNNQSSIASL
jgi:hypothetical protein